MKEEVVRARNLYTEFLYQRGYLREHARAGNYNHHVVYSPSILFHIATRVHVTGSLHYCVYIVGKLCKQWV